jgi:ADP-heptose:LPS heptosyltransferase
MKANADVAKVLVLQYRLPLGCLVHMTPVFEAIKRSRPEVEIAVATRGLGLEVLRHSPFVDHLIETPDPTTHLASAVLALRRQLRRRQFRPGCVLTGASDQRTRIALLALFASGWRGGYTQSPSLYRKPLVYDTNRSLIANNLRLATLLGIDPAPTEPRVAFSEADAGKAATLLETANPQGRPVVVLVTQNSGGQSTAWHNERWIEVIRDAAIERGLAVVFVGTAHDSAAIDELRAAAGNLGTSLAGKTSVNELAALLALSDFAVTIDTGTLHVARAVGLPVVVLATSWQDPIEWMPLEKTNARILRGPRLDRAPANYRLDEISAEFVIAALGELIALCPASPAARNHRLQASLSTVDLRGVKL